MPAKKSAFKFTKTALSSLPPAPAGKRQTHYDTQTPGLCVRTTSAGTKTFFLYRWVNGKPERIRLGVFPSMTVEQARKAAQQHLATIARGESPRAKKREQHALSITLGQVFREYLETRDLKPGTIRDYERVMVEAFADWRDRRIVDISRDAVERRHAQLSERSPARANNAMRVLRALLRFAAGRYEDAQGHPILADIATVRLSATRAWNRIERRQGVIRPHQLPAWWSAVGALEATSPTAADFLRLLILTGLRRTEAAQLRWADVDLEARTLKVPDTKNRRAHTLPLPDFLHELLERRHQHAAPDETFVFPGRSAERHFSEPREAIRKVIEQSGVLFTCHDLRRTFATTIESLDIPAYALKRLMNHKSAADVTAGYVIFDIERLREPMQRVCDFVLKSAGVRPSAEVVELRETTRSSDSA